MSKTNTKTKINTNIDNCDEPCSPAQLKYFSQKHYTYINQIFGDVTIRQIISEIFPNNNYKFHVEDVEEDNTDFDGGIHHVLYETNTNTKVPNKWCSVDEEYQDTNINENDSLCQSYTLLKYRNKHIVKGQNENKQKQRQMAMIKMYREILNDDTFIHELNEVVNNKANKKLWREYLKEQYQPVKYKRQQYVKMDKDHILGRIHSTLDCWERYGYKYFIGDGGC